MGSHLRRNSFDLAFHLKNKQVLEFTQLDRAIYQCFFDYIEKIGVRILNMKDAKRMDPSGGAGRNSREPGTAPAASPAEVVSGPASASSGGAKDNAAKGAAKAADDDDNE